jgi:WD40 repeat protein
LGLGEEYLLALRNEAIACLSLADVETLKEWRGNPPQANGFAFDSHYERYARSERDATISIRRVADDVELVRLKGPEVDEQDRRVSLIFGGGDRYLAAWYFFRKDPPLLLWDLRTASLCLRLKGVQGYCDFTPDGHLVAAAADRSIGVYDLPTGKQVRRLPPGVPPDHLAVHPSGRLMAVSSEQPPGVEIRDLKSGSVVKSLPHSAGVQGMAWDPTGQTLATACKDHNVYLWDWSAGSIQRVLRGHEWEVYHVQFNHTGELLISEGFDRTTRVWNVHTGKYLLQHPACRWIRFSADDQVAAASIQGPQVKLCGVNMGGGCRTLYGHQGMVMDIDFSPDGRLLASGCREDGVRLWELASCREIAHPVKTTCWGVLFEPDGNLLTYDAHAVKRWPIRREWGAQTSPGAIGEPKNLLKTASESGLMAWCGAPGRTLALTLKDGFGIMDPERPGQCIWRQDFPHSQYIATAPDGRWLAAGTWSGAGFRICRADTGQLVREEHVGDTGVLFSPDDRWLVTSTGSTSPRGAGCQFWQVGSWDLTDQIPAERTSAPAFAAFSPDGSLLAVMTTMTEVSLFDGKSRRPLATLRAREPIMLSLPRFSPDGRWLAVSTSQDVIQLWDLPDLRRRLAELQLDWNSGSATNSMAAGP